jgi:acetyl-CoA carboxylase biotin carboxyl carrier protein
VADPKLDLDQIRAVIKIASESPDVAELEVESAGLKVSVKKVRGAVRMTVSHGAPLAGARGPGAPHLSAPAGGNLEDAAAAAAGALADHLIPVTAPMVGTFYRAPNPDTPPFVNEGDTVEAGQTVCIVEAMKLFNEIQSEVAGRVARILVENAAPVEYGQSLMLIDTTGDT